MELSHGDSRARASRSYIARVGVKLGGSRFGSSRLEDGRSSRRLRYPSSSLVCLDPFVKLSIVDMLKYTTHKFYVLDFVFMNRLIKTSLLGFYVY